MVKQENQTVPEVPRLLVGQTALVTGASSGIGRATALALGRAGANVVVDYRSKAEQAQEVVDALQAVGAEAISVQADVSKEEDVQRLFAQSRAHFGTVDILVSNAGIQRGAPIAEMTLDQWKQVLDVNLTGQFLCLREATREFLRRGMRDCSRALGKIVCMSSVHEHVPWAGEANYAASKGGIHLMMASAAQELAEKRIRINAIAPGAIQTAINQDAWDTSASKQALLEKIPYGRLGVPEDVAQAVVWLVSDQADYVTGSTLVVDGGMSLYPSFRTGG